MSHCSLSQSRFLSRVVLGIRLAETVPITYIETDGTERTVDAEIGKNLLDVAHDNNVELEGAYSARQSLENPTQMVGLTHCRSFSHYCQVPAEENWHVRPVT